MVRNYSKCKHSLNTNNYVSGLVVASNLPKMTVVCWISIFAYKDSYYRFFAYAIYQWCHPYILKLQKRSTSWTCYPLRYIQWNSPYVNPRINFFHLAFLPSFSILDLMTLCFIFFWSCFENNWYPSYTSTFHLWHHHNNIDSSLSAETGLQKKYPAEVPLSSC